MIAAARALQRPTDARLLAIDRSGAIRHWTRSRLTELVHPGDLVIANDAATLPASLHGVHVESGLPIEVRLAGRDSLVPDRVNNFTAIVFGSGDFHIRTEDRALPPPIRSNDRILLGPLRATVRAVLHPRLLSLHFEGTPDEIWGGLARHGRPIQYAHVPEPLQLWDVWTPIAGPPVAFEPPSAGFVLDWQMLSRLVVRGVRFKTLTHAAGISSTGDPALDAMLPFDEAYRIPETTVSAIASVRQEGKRVIAIGTTVVRALEHAAATGTLRAGEGLATGRIGPATRLKVVDAIVSGTHEPGSSHYQLLRAFADDGRLDRVNRELAAHNYLTHEFGDSVFVERYEPRREGLY